MTETATRLRAEAGEADRYNNTPLDWTDPDSEAIPGCLFAPGGTSEDHDRGRDAVIVGPMLYAPFGSDIIAQDRIEVRDKTYEVEGEPEDWVGMSGWQAGMVVPLRRVDG